MFIYRNCIFTWKALSFHPFISTTFFQEKSTTNGYFHDDNLISLVSNLFTAGVETISTTLNWGFLLMLKYPEIQSKWFNGSYCYIQDIRDQAGTWRINTTVNRPRYKKQRFPGNYFLCALWFRPSEGHTVRPAAEQSSYRPGPLLREISLINK